MFESRLLPRDGFLFEPSLKLNIKKKNEKKLLLKVNLPFNKQFC